MAKFSGKIGYANNVEDSERPGIWTDDIIERQHYGDVIKDFNRYKHGEDFNSSLTISNKFSIVADSFSINNVHNMRYIHYNGGLWEVLSADIQRPRIIINVGGVYNGPIPKAT